MINPLMEQSLVHKCFRLAETGVSRDHIESTMRYLELAHHRVEHPISKKAISGILGRVRLYHSQRVMRDKRNAMILTKEVEFDEDHHA